MISDMKTAAIFTFQWSDNFGTVLQAYALQMALRKLGLDSSIVPLIPDTMCGIKRFMGRNLEACIIKWKRILTPSERDRRRKFGAFRHEFFNYSVKGLLPFGRCAGHRFDEDWLVFGSDNIWAPDVVQVGETQGDVFYGKSIKHPRKIAYAPSAGGDLRQSPHMDDAVECVRAAGFKAISCREDSTVAALKAAGIDAVCCPDPTLLLDAEDWRAVEDASACPSGDYYFGYDLGHDNERSVADICGDLAAADSSQACVCYPNDWKRTIAVGCAPTPQQWLALINHAKGIVTNSFHGVMFAIIFHRPFVFVPIVGENDRLNARAFGIIERLKAENCIYQRGCSVCEQLYRCRIDDSALSAFRQTGIEYLKQALGD